MRRLSILAGVICCLWSPLLGLADENAEKAVRAAIDSYVQAFNAGDAEAVAEHWAEDAVYTLPSGKQVEGRPAIREVFTKVFAESQPPKIDLIEARVRLIAKDVALEEGVVRVLNADSSSEDSSYVAVHVRKGKDWKLTTVHETVLPAAPENASHEHLKELAWLVGDWEEKTPLGNVECHFQWTKNHTFLTGQFKVPIAEGQTLEGTQVIGWDPEAEVIRSWMFDSAGGFGEGVWTRTNQWWSVKFVQVLPDGRRAAATNVYTQLNANSFEWKSIGRKVDGTFAPNIGPFQAVRVEAKSATNQPISGSDK